ncbi:hypothetical protein VNO78_30649 [Psophocarpus tetragonolobus]|uniref:Uncharacterized protein n=1 Tax=Psophocarpus tetragonolobus TaxID=3891 RepID=A0AAN9X725_PSOTE
MILCRSPFNIPFEKKFVAYSSILIFQKSALPQFWSFHNSHDFVKAPPQPPSQLVCILTEGPSPISPRFPSLATVMAALELNKSNKDPINTSFTFNSFKNNYFLVYSLMMGIDVSLLS